MSIPRFEDVVQVDWRDGYFPDDDEIVVRFVAGFMQRIPRCAPTRAREKAQSEVVELLRRQVHQSAAGTCKVDGDGACTNCGHSMSINANGYGYTKFCGNCGARLVDA